MLPSATIIAVLVNPTNPTIGEPFVRDLEVAARMLGFKLHVLHASTERDFEMVFATLVQLQAGALVISPDQFLTSRIEQLAQLTLLHGIPAISQLRQFTAAGALASYGSSETEYYRPIGIYAGRILKADHQSQNRQDTWPNNSVATPGSRRRGDRVMRRPVHHASRRRGGGVAAASAGSAACDAILRYRRAIFGERTKKLSAVAFVLRLRSIRMIYVVDAKFLRVVPPEMPPAVWNYRLAPSEDRPRILES
jgi:ABC transporter substrate binding protein